MRNTTSKPNPQRAVPSGTGVSRASPIESDSAFVDVTLVLRQRPSSPATRNAAISVPPLVPRSDIDDATNSTTSLQPSWTSCRSVGEVSSWIGGLASAAVHLLLLIMLGLLFTRLRADTPLEIEFVVAAVASQEPLETLTMSVDVLDPPEQEASADADQFQSLDEPLELAEPALAMNLSESGKLAEATPEVKNSATEPARGGDTVATKDAGMRGTFFGAAAYGDEFVYVVDMSTSMLDGSRYGRTKFQVACAELLRSVNQLTKEQKFCVIMFSFRTRFMFERPPKLIAATQSNKRKLATWIRRLRPAGGTDPRYGTMHALKLKADGIFLLSDGEFNGQNVNTHGIPGNVSIERIIARHRKGVTPIHTIAFEDLRNRRRLRNVSGETNGSHRFVGQQSNQTVLLMDLRSKHRTDVLYAMQSVIDGVFPLSKRETTLVAAECCKRLAAGPAEVRSRAHDCLVAIAAGHAFGPHDYGPHESDPSKAAYFAAKSRWFAYWQAWSQQEEPDQLTREDDALAREL